MGRAGEPARPLAIKPRLGRLSRCLYGGTLSESFGNVFRSDVFQSDLQLFVPTVQKDARLARGRKSRRDRPFGISFRNLFQNPGNEGLTMKLVVAIIKPFKLDEVRQALTAIGVSGMTVTEVKGYGRQKGHTEVYRGAEYVVNFLPKLRIEIAVASDLADRAVSVITSSARTGQIGDGKIFVTPIDHALRIRTGETDSDAL
jgi:nitrogen regulatory protein P-II 2